MHNWEEIRPIVEDILQQPHYTGGGEYNATPCFLTAYQIAILVNDVDDTLKGDLQIGGVGIGEHNSFAKQIARHLSKDRKDGAFGNRLEIQFMSRKGIDSFYYGGKESQPVSEFSMFRLLDAPK